VDKKRKKDLRVNLDDRRRLKEIWDWVLGLLHEYEPDAVGVEAFQPGFSLPGKQVGAGNRAWKTGMAYALMNAAAWTIPISLHTFLPQDVKKAFHLKGGTSKMDVAYTLALEFSDLPDLIDSRPKKQHEHLYDAVGLAYLAFQETLVLRRLMGMS